MSLSPNTETSIEEIKSQLERIRLVMWDKITFSTTEVACKVGLDEKTISKYCRTGIIKSFQPYKGGPYLIPTSELDRILFEAEDNLISKKKISTTAFNIINKTK